MKPDTDGDGASDGAEVAQGSDPTDPSDGGQPPPATELVTVPFRVGDPSGSHSERWRMDIVGKGPADFRRFGFVSPTFGQMGSTSFKLRRGNTYAVTLAHVATNDPYGEPDYDWEAQLGGDVQTRGEPETTILAGGQTHSGSSRYVSLPEYGIVVDNRDGLFGEVNQGFYDVDHTVGKTGLVHVVKVDVSWDDEPVAGFQGGVSRMLTVWRRLHLEIDSMEEEPTTGDEVNTFAVSVVGYTENLASTTTVAKVSANLIPAYDYAGQFENGVLTVPTAGTFRVRDSVVVPDEYGTWM